MDENGRTISELAAEAGITYSAMWKRLHPEATAESNRRSNANRPDRNRSERVPCPQCGKPKMRRRSQLCEECARERDRRRRDQRCRRIEAWWADGLPMWMIAGRLGWTVGTLGGELDWMRHHGYSVPHRHRYPHPRQDPRRSGPPSASSGQHSSATARPSRPPSSKAKP